jgi:phage terminase large subunit-like protein
LEQDKLFRSLSKGQIAALEHDWDFWGRPDQQLPPDIIPWSGRNWLTWVILAGRGWGKLLDNNTPIPTPSGWTTMGDIKEGDELFDEAGRPCRVLAKYSPPIEQAYRLTFSDGSTLDADAGHQWVTWTHAERKAFLRSAHQEDASRFPDNWPQWRVSRVATLALSAEIVKKSLALRAEGVPERKIEEIVGASRQALRKHWLAGRYLEREPVIRDGALGPRIRTTQEIVDTLRYGRRGDVNHCIPCCGALDLPEIDLPIPPYTLGVWLGDGHSAGGTISAHEDDAPFTRGYLLEDGFRTTDRSHPQAFGVLGLSVLLRRFGLLNNKHVPPVYMRASIRQRLALLRGLMDTDGNIEYCNTVAFVNTNERLIKAVEELVHSLGMKTRVWSGVGAYNGNPGRRFWRVQFTPTVNPFSLPRKAEKIVLGGNQSLRNHHRMIVGVEPIAPVPMSCITVDSPNSMYLVGKQMIPTHNTRTGAETIRNWACGSTPLAPGRYSRIGIVGETAKDVRDVLIEGNSGILAVHHKDFRPIYEPSKSRLTWPNGATANLYNATEPDQLRGPQFECAWLDELAKWRYAKEVWDQLQFGMRLGDMPRKIITTTPRPISVLKQIMALPTTWVTRGSTLDNADNLADSYVEEIVERYKGTRLGRQELDAEIVEDIPDALWTLATIEKANQARADLHGVVPDMQQIVVAIDPSGSSGDDEDKSDSQGIVVAGKGADGRVYVLADLSCKLSPHGWARRAVDAYHLFQADRIIGEKNFGGAMIEANIRNYDPNVPYKDVVASRGKAVRAEPVSSLYERGKVVHLGRYYKDGKLVELPSNQTSGLEILEDQMSQMTTHGFLGKGSPDRVDALVWAISELMPQKNSGWAYYEYAKAEMEKDRQLGILIEAEKVQPVKKEWAKGSVEWQAEQDAIANGAEPVLPE